MNMGFVIAGVFLGMCAAVGGFVLAYETVVLAPLAEEEFVEMQTMGCEEITELVSIGLFWSVENYEWAEAKKQVCKDLEKQ